MQLGVGIDGGATKHKRSKCVIMYGVKNNLAIKYDKRENDHANN
jgi:hypothetical protein